jgi:hypothetical protein
VLEAGVDPKWLLTGDYDPAVHRQALWLGEDRSASAAQTIRTFVQNQYQQLFSGGLSLLPLNASG